MRYTSHPYFSISGPLGPEQLHYDWIVADGPLEALHRFHAEALGSTRSGSIAGGWYFWTPNDREICARC